MGSSCWVSASYLSGDSLFPSPWVFSSGLASGGGAAPLLLLVPPLLLLGPLEKEADQDHIGLQSGVSPNLPPPPPRSPPPLSPYLPPAEEAEDQGQDERGAVAAENP